MNRGNRPTNEYAVASQQRTARTSTPEPQGAWPELRVVRQAAIGSPEAPDWDDFLNGVGRANYGMGSARALGSLAVVMIPAKAMGVMLQDKYPTAYKSRDKTIKLQRKLGQGLQSFMRSAQQIARSEGLRDMEVASIILTQSMSNDYGDEPNDYRSAVSDLDMREALLPVGSGQLPFDDGEFPVRGVGLFGPGYALDLSGAEQLSDERFALLKYLRAAEGLDTRRLESDGWMPHATIFTPEEHHGTRTLPRSFVYRDSHPPMIDLKNVQSLVIN